jgi:hypothetical protein
MRIASALKALRTRLTSVLSTCAMSSGNSDLPPWTYSDRWR